MRTEEMVIQIMTDRLIEFEKYYGMGKNVKKTKLMRILSRQASQVQMIDKKNNWKKRNISTVCVT
jgi:hypothetical protein